MAKKRKTTAKRGRSTRRRGRRQKRGNAMQKLLVGFSGAILVLCAASITFGFFVRQGGGADGRFHLRVLNGTGEKGLAHQARLGLLRRGIDVLDVGNARHFDYKETVLISHREDLDLEELRKAIGCEQVLVQVDESLLEDATLILGEDYRDLRLEWDSRSDLSD